MQTMQTIHTHLIPAIKSWAQAKEVWEKAKPFKVDPDWRYLTPKRNDASKVIRRLGGDKYAVRFHHTDIVVYQPDGAIAVRHYPSVSTALFINRCTPDFICASNQGNVPRVNQRRSISNNFYFRPGAEQPDEYGLIREYNVRRVKNTGPTIKRMREYLSLRQAHQLITEQVVINFRGAVSESLVDHVRRWTDNAIATLQHGQYELLNRIPDEHLLIAAAIVDRAIVREPVPFGTLPKKMTYSHLWDIVEDR
jgi:hypothetical protein